MSAGAGSMFSTYAKERIGRELDPGEELVWAGQPSLGGGEQVYSFTPAQMGPIIRRERANGTEDVYFNCTMDGTPCAARRGLPHKVSDGFLGVRDAREVERVLRALTAEAGKRSRA